MATEASKLSSSSADSYIGSLISLTSKSEIRYEGILYNINTEESSIGLRNVRSFGTEGRKKDGPQLMPSDKVYEYILFRGSDIKDLQVKSSSPAPAQPTQPINSDPAIIQSHYPQPPQQSSTLPAAANNSLNESNIQNQQMGHPGSTLQGGPPLYQPNGNLGPWGPMPPPPNANSSGLPMPTMYWPGFYGPPNGLPQLHQQSMLRPPLSLQQPMQYPNYNPSLPGGPPIQPPEYPPVVSTKDNLPSFMQNNPVSSVGPTAPLIGSLQSLSLSNTNTIDVNSTVPPVSNKPSVPSELPTPSLVTPGQLLQSVSPTSQFTQVVHKDVEVVQVSQTQAPVPAPASEPSVPVVVPVPTEAQPPILPLPPQQCAAQKTNGAPYQNRQSYNYRGRERGRGGYGGSRSVMKFTEEFDFTAMNEKFNKDEIWGTMETRYRGKSNKKENDGNASDEDEYEDQNDAADLPQVDVKPVYSKDDFFDTLSYNSLDKQSSDGRPRFSEQMKLDTETFGEFFRYRGGGRGPYRGGRTRGGGYYGRGGGYHGRGRGVGGGGRTPNANRDY